MSKKELDCTNCCIDDFKNNLCDCDGEFCKKFKCVGNAEDFIKSVMSMSERKRGKWIMHQDGSGTCDQCRTRQMAIWDFDGWQNFCGHCGADMRGQMECNIK